MASFSGNVTGGSLYLRSSTSTTSQSLISIPNGTALTVTTISGNNEWFSTTYSGKSGYVLATYIAITTGGTAATVTTESGSLNIRATPSSSATISFSLAKGASLRILDTTAVSGFYRIGSSSGCGWGSTQYITQSGSGGGSTGTWYTRYINTPGETLKIRSSANNTNDNNVVATWPHGTEVQVNAPTATWSEVKKPDQSVAAGYCMTSFLVTSPPAFTGVPSSGALYCGKTNTTQVMCRKNITGTATLGNFEKDTPVGYRLTSDSAWVETYWGFNPTLCGYSSKSLITSTTVSKAQLLADIAKTYYDKGWNMSTFGMSGKWCQWFVNFCVTQAGLGVQNSGWTSNTNCTGGWGAMSSGAATKPTVGSIFYTKTAPDTVTHTGIVVSVDLNGTSCMVVDGNYNGSSSLTHRSFNPSAMPSGVTFLGFVKANGT